MRARGHGRYLCTILERARLRVRLRAFRLRCDSGSAGLRLTRASTGTGNITLGSTSNDWTGGLTLDAGNTVTLGASGVVTDTNLITFAAVTTAANAVAFNLNGFNETVRGLAGGGSTATVPMGGGTLTLNVPGAESHSFAGLLGASGNTAGTLIKTGTGSQTFTAASSNFAGAMQVNQGALRASHASALGSATGGTTVASGAALEATGSGTFAEPLTLNGTGISNGGALRNVTTSKTWSGAITLGSTGVRINSDNLVLTLSGGVSPIIGLSNPDLTIGTTTSTGAAVAISTNPLNIGTGTLTKDGIGRLSLATASTMGALQLNGGRLDINHDDGAGSATVSVANASGISITSSGATGQTILFDNPIVLADGATPTENPVTIYSLTAGHTLNLAGQISGSRSLFRGISGTAGTVILSGDNTFSGGVTISDRGLVLGHRNGLGTGPLTFGDATAPLHPIAISANAALTGADAVDNAVVVTRDFTIGGTTDSPGGTSPIEFSGTMDLGAATRVVTVANTGGATFSGVISGASGAGLTKAGTSTLTLDGANTQSGDTTVNAGLLVYARGAAASAASKLSVGAAGGVSLAQQASPWTSDPDAVYSMPDLAIAAGGVLDIENNKLTLAAPTITENDLRAMKSDGRIVQSTGVAGRAVGYRNSGASLVIAYAGIGDSNLDGQSDNSDISALILAGKYVADGSGSTATWDEGDWNGDGVSSAGDISALILSGLYGSGMITSAVAPGSDGDGVASIVYDPATGALTFDKDGDARDIREIKIASAGGHFVTANAENVGFLDVNSATLQDRFSLGSAFANGYDLGNLLAGVSGGYDALDDLTVQYGVFGGGSLVAGDLIVLPVPEPSAVTMIGIGATSLLLARRKRRSVCFS